MKILAISVLLLISINVLGQPSTSSGTKPSTPSTSLPSTGSGTKGTDVLPTDSQTHKIMYSEWVKVDGANADDLYNKAAAWLLKKNDSAENVFHVVKEKAKISTRGYTWLTIPPQAGMKYSQRELTRELFYTITINVKDGGYRFTMGDFYFHYFANSIFSSDRDSALESVYNGKPHDDLTQRYFNQVGSTAKHFSEH